MEKLGTKETQEAMSALLKVTAVMAKHLKDGAQLNDFAKVYADIMADEALKLALQKGYEDVKMVPAELKDLELVEGFQLFAALVPDLMAMVEALKKQA
jgi:chaperonin GroEL (HSP60 family)